MATWRAFSAGAVAFLALLSGLVFNNYRALSLVFTNSPDKLQHVSLLPGVEVKFQDIVRNCEDVYMSDGEGWAILSCDPGRDKWNTVMGTIVDPVAPPETGLYIYRYGTDAQAKPKKLRFENYDIRPEDFHPLGIEYIPQSRTLFMINHAQKGSRIDRFRFYAEEEMLRFGGSIEDSLLPTPNSMAALSPSSLIVTNDHYFRSRYQPRLAMAETMLGLPLGTVVRVDLDISMRNGPPNITSLVRVPFANGVVELNKTAIAVASSSRAEVYIYSSESGFNRGSTDVKISHTIQLPFPPDNLSMDGNGILFITGPAHGPSLSQRAAMNAACVSGQIVQCPKSPSFIASWTAESGVEVLYVGDEFDTITTTVWDVSRRVGIATGLYAKGIMTFKEAEA